VFFSILTQTRRGVEATNGALHRDSTIETSLTLKLRMEDEPRPNSPTPERGAPLEEGAQN